MLIENNIYVIGQLSSHHLRFSALLFYLYSSFWLLCHIWMLADLSGTYVFYNWMVLNGLSHTLPHPQFSFPIYKQDALIAFQNDHSFVGKQKTSTNQHILLLIEIMWFYLKGSSQMIWLNMKGETISSCWFKVCHLS